MIRNLILQKFFKQVITIDFNHSSKPRGKAVLVVNNSKQHLILTFVRRTYYMTDTAVKATRKRTSIE